MTAMYRVTVVVTGVAGAPYYLTGYFAQSGGTAQDAADAWFTFATRGAADSETGSKWAYPTEVFSVESTTGEVSGVSAAVGSDLNGTYTGEMLPRSNQCLIRWSTNTYNLGREIQGRTNLPLMILAGNDDGAVLPAVIADFGLKATNLIADVNSSFVIWSRKLGTVAVVQSGTCWNQFAILRSRR